MKQFRPALFVTGIFLMGIGLIMWVPMLYMLFLREPDWQAFMLSSLITLGTGMGMALLNRQQEGFMLVPRQVFVLTSLTWVSACVFAALPLLMIHHGSYTEAFFETVSGLTTTGATVLTGLDQASRGVLLWRSLLQWIGGIGFVAMGVLVLPFLRVGGMRLFHSESSDRSEKVLPRFESVAKLILLCYVILTVANALAYYAAGMSMFDAINHAMTTVATAGFSTHDASLGHFNSLIILWIAVVFMVLGSLPFALYIFALRGNLRPLWADSQVRGLVGLVLFFGVMLTVYNILANQREPVEALTASFFNAVSIMTTTGFASENYSAWGELSVMVFFYLAFIGGCSGSTTGGLKIFRFQVAYTLLRRQLDRLVHPRAVFSERYNNREISEDIIRALISFSFFFALTIGLLAFGLSAVGLDFMTSLTGAVSAVCNVGPGLGPVIGPDGNYSTLPDLAKWMLCAGMLLGRLEIMTVLVVLTPTFWRS